MHYIATLLFALLLGLAPNLSETTVEPNSTLSAVEVETTSTTIQDNLQSLLQPLSDAALAEGGPCEEFTFYNLTRCTQHLIFLYDCDGDGEPDEGEDIFLDPVNDDGTPSIRWVRPHCEVVAILYGGTIPIGCDTSIAVEGCAALFY